MKEPSLFSYSRTPLVVTTREYADMLRKAMLDDHAGGTSSKSADWLVRHARYVTDQTVTIVW